MYEDTPNNVDPFGAPDPVVAPVAQPAQPAAQPLQQQPAQPPVQESAPQGFSFEDLINDSQRPLGIPIEQTVADPLPEDTPTQPNITQQQPSAVPPVDNEQVRYQYWQSIADKEREENKRLQQELATFQASQQQVAPVQPDQQPAIPDKFPELPPAPEKPYNFDMMEAQSDRNSESYKYLNEKAQYDQMRDEYIQYKIDYVQQQADNRVKGIEQKLKDQSDQARAREESKAKLNAVYGELQQKHGMNPQQAQQFIQYMSSPESKSMENLVALYQQKFGQQVQQPQAQGIPLPQGFQQVRNAQSLPLGIDALPGAAQPAQSAEDVIFKSIMDLDVSSNAF